MAGISRYYNEAAIASEVAAGRHRESVGGAWEEIGKRQFDFLCANGLVPTSTLLDIGCGCLRGGIHLVDFLDRGHYYGIDLNSSLLEAGYDIEIRARGLCEKLPREHLLCSEDFEFSNFRTKFDYAIAHSLFTHLPENHIRLCLSRLAPMMNPAGRLFGSFFLVPDEHPIGLPFDHKGGIRTFDHRDPYHYRFWQLRQLVERLAWRPSLVGRWDHPRDQQMVLFDLDCGQSETEPDHTLRALTACEAAALPAGAPHYRAYVGPPERYDFMSASQFALLFAFGLRESHRVLDVGCGSLRLGRLLIPYLRPGHYYGLEPSKWLIDDGIKLELGNDVLGVKQPSFSFNDDFSCDVFRTKFDYIVAQSILTHCGPDAAAMLLQAMRVAL